MRLFSKQLQIGRGDVLPPPHTHVHVQLTDGQVTDALFYRSRMSEAAADVLPVAGDARSCDVSVCPSPPPCLSFCKEKEDWSDDSRKLEQQVRRADLHMHMHMHGIYCRATILLMMNCALSRSNPVTRRNQRRK